MRKDLDLLEQVEGHLKTLHTVPSQLKNPRVSPPDESLDLIMSASPCRQGIGITFESYFHGSSCKTALVNSLISAKRVSLRTISRSVAKNKEE